MHNWHVHEWINQFSTYLTHCLEHIQLNTNWGWNGQTKMVYTSSYDSGTESILLRHILVT